MSIKGKLMTANTLNEDQCEVSEESLQLGTYIECRHNITCNRENMLRALESKARHLN